MPQVRRGGHEVKVILEVFLDHDEAINEDVAQVLIDATENDILTQAIDGALEANDLDAHVELIDAQFES